MNITMACSEAKKNIYSVSILLRLQHCSKKKIHIAFIAFNDGKCKIGVFIDFSKAFDTIDHKILLNKLELFSFNKSAINWIKSFLSSRTQQTQIESVLSQPKIISCGVPQGSILGPTLFLI